MLIWELSPLFSKNELKTDPTNSHFLNLAEKLLEDPGVGNEAKQVFLDVLNVG